MTKRTFLPLLATLLLATSPVVAQDLNPPAVASTSPGGSTTQLQYNNASAFGGTSGLTWDGSHLALATAGTLSAPSITIGAGQTGLYATSSSVLGIAVNGNLRLDYGISSGATWTFVNAVIATSYQAVGAVGGYINNTGVSGGSGDVIGFASGANSSGSRDTAFSRDAAGVIDVGTGAQGSKAGKLQAAGYNLGSTLTLSGTAATISSAGGLGTSPSITANGSVAMDITAGSSTSAASFTVGLPTAANGWVCNGNDITTQSVTVFVLKQVGGSTATAIMELFTTAALAAAPVAGDHIRISCVAY